VAHNPNHTTGSSQVYQTENDPMYSESPDIRNSAKNSYGVLARHANWPEFGKYASAPSPSQSSMQWGNLDQINNNIQGAYTEPLSPAEIQRQQMGALTKIPSQYGTNAYLPSTKGQKTDIGFFGEGGYADTGISAFKALGGLYLGNEQRKLAASDLDFRRDSFNKQYGNQVATVNDQLYDRQRRRNLESGMDVNQAGSAADEYVRNRGVGQERRTVR